MNPSATVVLSEESEQLPKAKRKSKLSLNSSSDKLKSKPKDATSTGQASIRSFFGANSSNSAELAKYTNEKSSKSKERSEKQKLDAKRKRIKQQDNGYNNATNAEKKSNISTVVVDEPNEIAPKLIKNKDKHKKTQCDDNSTENCAKKLNAFTFMMDNRHKSIGQNSPGKELEKTEESPEIMNENKRKLSTRKAIFEEWADRKGNKKRKIEEDEKGVIIEKKLKKRAKRLKKMLNIDQNEGVRVNSDSIDERLKENHTSCVIDVADCGKGISINRQKKQKKKSIVTLSKNKGDSSQKENGNRLEMEWKPKKKQTSTCSSHKWKMKLKLNINSDELDNLNTVLSDVVAKSSRKTDKKKENAKVELVDGKQAVPEEEEFITKRKRKSQLIYSSSDSDEVEVLSPNNCIKNVNKKKPNKKNTSLDIKIAPLFMMAKPKFKVDKAVVEARKQFLHSSMPELLKKAIEKQQITEIPDYEIFPTVSHIKMQPNLEQLKFCNLSQADLKLTAIDFTIPQIGTLTQGVVTNLINLESDDYNCEPIKNIKDFKSILKELKDDNPDYPIYKTFKCLYKKHKRITQTLICKPEPTKKPKRGRPKKKLENSDMNVISAANDTAQCNDLFQVWTDLYRPSKSEEIFGNQRAVSQLKTWLESWLEFSKELNSHTSKRRNSNSSSDFEDDDGNSRNNSTFPVNTFILIGPHSSGKTTAVYAVCNELEIKVLELNASSKRTGKKLLLELHEATQSYQVRKGHDNCLSSFLQADDSNSNKAVSNKITGEMCLLLIEDVDLVFDQDDGFLPALSQLLATSKRPVVLTTTDRNCLHLQKCSSQFPIVTFSSLSTTILTPWLQLVCLIEGLFVMKEAIVSLLESNRGDIRRTLLQLQFWVQSGGQPKLTVESSSDQAITLNESSVDNTAQDHISWLKDDELELYHAGRIVHKNCMEYQMSVSLDLGSIWWRFHADMGISPPLRSSAKADKNELPVDINKQLPDIKLVSKVLDTLALADLVYTKLYIHHDMEPVHKNMQQTISNSLELDESEESYSSNRGICYEWTNMLYDGYSSLTGTKEIAEHICPISERRWQTKQSKCKENFLEIVPLVSQLQRDSVSLDYFTAFRTISRTEMVRASNNSKRGNRFYNYLRGLGLNCNKSYFEIISNAFYQKNS